VRRTLRREPLWLLGLVAASTAVRTAAAFGRPSPLYYPDEYLYSSLARSIAGSGVPRIRGAFVHFPALLGPYLMAPAWLGSNVDHAYRLALAWGSLWFSLAALPAYALARRVDVSAGGALFVAALTVLLPDAAFTTTLLSEPFAYPALLLVVLVAIDAIAEPTHAREAGFVVLAVALCLLRVQFLVVPAAYLVAALACYGFSPRALVRRQPVVTGAVLAGALVSAAVGVGRVAGVYSGVATFHVYPGGIARWFGLDLFVLAVAAGWVVVPGAVIGFVRFARAGTPRQRAFAFLSAAVGVGVLAEAALFGAHESRIHERYVFYVAPLVVILFVWALEWLARDRLYALVAYGSAAAALFLPAVSGVRGAADDESPTVLGLNWLTGGGPGGTLAWALVLAAAAVVTGLRLRNRLVTPLLAVAIVLVTGTAGSIALLRFGPTLGARLDLSDDVPRLGAPAGTALVVSPDTSRYLLMKTLFWNPAVTRVLVLGRGPAPDGYASTRVRLVPGRGLVDDRGRVVHGPFAIDTDTVAAAGAVDASPGSLPAVLRRAPSVLFFGWNRNDGYLATTALVSAVADAAPVAMTLSLASPTGTKRVSLVCPRSTRFATVGRRPTAIRVVVPAGSTLGCRLSLVRGAPLVHDNRTVAVRGERLRLRPLAGGSGG
jgi:hypothetical protein